MAVTVHPSWSSHTAFLLATAGAAVGLGNLWRFPFLTGQNGGAAFVLVYILFVFLIGVPIVIAEISMGRMGHLSPIGSVRAIIRAQGASAFWQAIGYMSLAVPFVGFTYYSVVAGWSVSYVASALQGDLVGISTEQSQGLFQNLLVSPLWNLLFQGLVIFGTAWVVGRGLHKGIERTAKIMMPMLFLILLVMIGYNFFEADFGGAFRFLFTPDFSKLTGTTLMVALGQAFFSVGVGVGFMITYGAYLPRNISVPVAGVIVCGVDTLVALLAGMAIFPIVLASGLSPGEGPGLVFITMPVAFGSMPLGHAVGVLFFVLLFVAAFTSTIGMLEPLVSFFEEKWRATRLTLALAAGAAIWAVGVFPALSGNVLSGIRPLSFLEPLAEKSVFEAFDFFTASIMIPVNAFLISLFAGWIVSATDYQAELRLSRRLFSVWQILLRVVAPLAVLSVTLYGLLS